MMRARLTWGQRPRSQDPGAKLRGLPMWSIKMSGAVFAAAVLAMSAYGMTQADPGIVKNGLRTVDTVKVNYELASPDCS